MPDTIDDAQEQPIIFNDWSIQRILAGEKTQTRRIVNPQPPDNADRVEIERGGALGYFSGDTAAFHDTTTCPYGQPGDVLWVREGFQFPEFEDDVSPRDLVDYWVGEAGAPPPVKYSTGETKRAWNGHDWGRKRPSIHMPRELCRIRLRVEDVRVERVQEIYASDCAAEGISSEPSFETDNPIANATKTIMRRRFRRKWNDIHGDGAWERNDWVWVIEFARYDE